MPSPCHDDASTHGQRASPKVSIQALAQAEVFRLLSPAQLTTLAQSCRWHHCDAGETLASSHTDGFCVVAAGRLLLSTYERSGRQVAFEAIAAGECFGMVPMLLGPQDGESVEAIAVHASLIAQLDAHTFTAMVRNNPDFALAVLREQARAIRRFSQRIVEFSTLTVRGRLQVALLRMGQFAGVQANRARLVPAPRHQGLASYIGTKREQVTREMSWLQRQGLVAREGNALILCDVAGLQQALEDSRLKG